MPTEHPRTSRDPLEAWLARLYALWAFGMLLVLLLAGLLTAFGRAALQRHSRAIQQLAQRIDRIESHLNALPVPAPDRTLLPPRDQDDESDTTPARPATRPDRGRAAAGLPSVAGADDTGPVGPATIRTLLDRALAPDEQERFAIADRDAAETLLNEARGWREASDPSPEVLEQVAIVARLLDDEELALALAARAHAAGRPVWDFDEVSARALLAAGRLDEALSFASRLQSSPRSDLARYLIAAIHLARENWGAADEALTAVDPSPLASGDRIALGWGCVALERWQILERVLRTLEGASGELALDRDLLRAVLFIQQRRLVEALAVLDYLREARPEDEEVRMWRGAALVQAGQLEAARAVLRPLADSGRAGAWYWLARLEADAGHDDEARQALHRSLELAPRLVAAWERLGELALDDDPAQAAQFYASAARINPRRAASHFGLARAWAGAGQLDRAADALRRAVQLEPLLLEQARSDPVFAKAFTPDELERLLALPATRPAKPSAQEPAPP